MANEGDRRLKVTDHGFSGLRRSDRDDHKNHAVRRKSGLAGVALLATTAAGCGTTIDAAQNPAGLNHFINTGQIGTTPDSPVTFNAVPANKISLVAGGIPQPIREQDTSTGLSFPETAALAKIHSNLGIDLPLGFDFSAASSTGSDQQTFYKALRKDLARPHPWAVTVTGIIDGIPQDTVDRLRGLGVNAAENEIFNIQTLTIDTPETSKPNQGTSALAPRLGQLPSNQQLYGRRPNNRRV